MTRLVSYYGDDFTGSTDVMEALAKHGVKTVLFTRKPTHEEFEPFRDFQAFGLAGTSRSETPDWMDEHLPPHLQWLKSLNARYCHYKVCSTFDSASHIGNIGRATEIGAQVFGQSVTPLIVGAPQLKRYTFAGHLFAAYQGETFRIDRHPVMSRHPVTPMHEADLRLHLAKQTSSPVVLFHTQWPEHGIGLLDVHDETTQLTAGEQLLDWPGGFVVGSSGLEYALLKALVKRGQITGHASFAPLPPVAQMIVVSGSVSPMTAHQIRNALQHGFEAVPVDAVELAQGNASVRAKVVEVSFKVLSSGKSPLIYSALGPSSDHGSKLDAVKDGRKSIGLEIGAVLKALLQATNISRVAVAGGDTSSHALSQLDIFALTTRCPIRGAPGSPLCVAASKRSKLSGIEIALKGGQLGGDNYFVALRDGGL
jgi:3-oxoisoapionate kinase